MAALAAPQSKAGCVARKGEDALAGMGWGAQDTQGDGGCSP